MTRVFQRGELRAAVLAALAGIEPANGYGIMQALEQAIGGGWTPSPGAIYPAILGLEDAGAIRGTDDGHGSRTYVLTPAGHELLGSTHGTLARVADRARSAGATPTLGALLDAFESRLPGRSTRLDPRAARAIDQILDRASVQLERILTKENRPHG